mmetsp:Transcript_15718/g.44579  ORF Transcript_15718/g.44579 Transcript_15718/m.44579 type:complete len:153 (+) Transcript_15718:107-565(+)|eukprot:CAMPEP_0119118592 /NCGR_PEP_ID=MMETSP1310-20130426/423_1 /TAXON_ID=464262 /ORGANISM="Genus nov. species nov., Strain RCC2339" /LENGTH=152 /DNA_ID=CAMNT_0007107977 /DNA_START=63 /DNA_END=521 /DNA_ORIENTATION=+
MALQDRAKRMQMEKTILNNYGFLRNGAEWGPNDEYITVSLSTNVCPQQVFKVRLYLKSFPNNCPPMVVVQPKVLLQRDNKTPIPPGSHHFHTLGKVDGYQQICHYRPNLWKAQNTIFMCFLKARFWLEAYMCYRLKGKDMDFYLANMEDARE